MWFDKLTTNGINKSPFVLSLSKDKKGFARNETAGHLSGNQQLL